MKRIRAAAVVVGMGVGLFGASGRAFGEHEHMPGSERPPVDPNGAAAKPWPTRDPRALRIREAQVERVYRDLLYPTPKAILSGTKTVDDIFERDVVRGRVTPVGEFDQFEGVIEYFYGLAVTPGSQVRNVTFRSLFAGDDKVAVAVDIYFCRAPYQSCDPSKPVAGDGHTLTQVGFYTFNRANRIVSFDLTILNLGAISDPPSDPTVRDSLIAQTCTALTRAHVDPRNDAVVPRGTCTTSFDSADDFPAGFGPVGPDPFQNCVTYMKTLEYGSWNRANSNTFVCRQLHTIMTALRPDVHCPHASPGGGMTCIDFPYGSFYDKTY